MSLTISRCKGDLLVELEDKNYQAQVDQAHAAIAAARAAIEDNLRQRELQDAKIAKALAGIDQAKAQIAAAQAGKESIEAGRVRARSELGDLPNFCMIESGLQARSLFLQNLRNGP